VDVSSTHDRAALKNTELAFLNEITLLKEDSLLGLVTGFASRLPPDANPGIIDSVSRALSLCLRDDAHQRGSLAQVTKSLAQGTTENRPTSTRASARMISPVTSSNTKLLLHGQRSGFYQLQPSPLESPSGNLTIRIVNPDYERTGARGYVASTKSRPEPIAPMIVDPPSQYRPMEVDMFKVRVGAKPTIVFD
jgi:hypothetical protein